MLQSERNFIQSKRRKTKELDCFGLNIEKDVDKNRLFLSV